MAAPRAEAAHAEPGAQSASVPAANPGPSPAWKAWLPLGVALVVMPLLAYATTTYVLIPRMQKALRTPEVSSAKASSEVKAEPAKGAENTPPRTGQRQSFALNKLLVNVAGTLGSRYLLTSLTLAGDANDFSGLVSRNEAQLRDMATGVLSTKTIADLERPGVRNQLRSELLAGFNSVLGKDAVQEIYFTDFAIQ